MRRRGQRYYNLDSGYSHYVTHEITGPLPHLSTGASSCLGGWEGRDLQNITEVMPSAWSHWLLLLLLL